MKPPPYCSSLQDGGGFSVSRLRLVGEVPRGVPDSVRMRSQGLLATVEASPEPVGRGWWQQSRLHRTTRAGGGERERVPPLRHPSL